MKLFTLIAALLIVTIAGGIGIFTSLLSGFWICAPMIAVSLWYVQGQLFEALANVAVRR